MVRSIFSKAMWVGRATVFLIGLAVILALLFGAASTALGTNGKPFLLGKRNGATNVSTLIKRGVGPALNLKVRDGQPPLAVDSSRKVANLNADEVDGLSANELRGQQGPPGPGAPLSVEEKAGTVTTTSETYVTDPNDPGPTVQVDVPAGGWIEVFAQVDADDDDGAVGLFDVTNGEPGTFVAGQDTLCVSEQNSTLPGALFTTTSLGAGPTTFSTPSIAALTGACSATGPPGPVLIKSSQTGPRTFRLKYADCGCDAGGAAFSNRRLMIAPRPLAQ
jgi:hypothetical protein